MKPSQERIDRTVRFMKRMLADPADGAKFRKLEPASQRLYIEGLLICNDAGVIPKAEIEAFDAERMIAAELVIGRCGLLDQPPILERLP